ncbi:MAG TPA: Calx-beta domain-containing protein, partial [Gemmataceae bacterium]|nr:Calx-beta domain-containing protein [Gemmataceae bacterium]
MAKRIAVTLVKACVALLLSASIDGSGRTWAGTPVNPYGGPFLHFEVPSYWVGQNEGTVPVNIILSATSSQTVTVTYQATDVSATCPGNYEMDYYVSNSSATSGTVSFCPGQRSKTIYVTLINNSVTGRQRFKLELSNPVNAALGYVRSASVVIFQDGPAAVSNTPQGKDLVFADEVMYAHAIKTNAFKRTYKESINELIHVRDAKESKITLRIWYVGVAGGPAEFAKHAVDNAADKSTSYFGGHGTGNKKVSETVRLAAKKAFDAKPRPDTAKFGLNCCFPNPYNLTVPEKNRLKDMG